jgi:hypothetical protein
MKTKRKTETIEEFLARGGSIRFIPPKQEETSDKVRKTTNGGPAIIMTLEDADLFYGEVKKGSKKSSKPSNNIDLSALPEALKNKFISRLKAEAEEYGEEGEEDF